MNGTAIRCLRFYTGKSLLDRYNAYPLMLTVSTVMTQRRSLIGIPLCINSHANFTSASKGHAESKHCKEEQGGEETDQLVKILAFYFEKKKTLEIYKGISTLDREDEETIKMALRKSCGGWNMKFEFVTSITVEISVSRCVYF
jgi:hypothetical protein